MYNLASILSSEIEHLKRALMLPLKRGPPAKVEVVEEPLRIHRTSSLKNDTLRISAEVFEGGGLDAGRRIVRKEVLSMMISSELDELVPQVHDLAWVASGLSRKLWERARLPPHPKFSNYDPYMLEALSRGTLLTLVGSLISIMNESSELGNPDFFIYFSLLRRAVVEEVEFNQSEMTVLRALTDDPTIKPKGIKEKYGLSEPTISRALRKLRLLGFIFGPENVNTRKLGLSTISIEYPNVRELRNAFWDFPFTYTQVVPASSEVDALALLLMPQESLPHLIREFRSLGFGVFKSKLSYHGFRIGSKAHLWEVIGRALQGNIQRQGRFCEGRDGERERFRLLRDDLRILNHVMVSGRVTIRDVEAMGVSSPRYRLSRLREYKFIMRKYMVEVPKGLDLIYVKIWCEEEEFPKVARIFTPISACTLHYMEGPGFRGCAGMVFVGKDEKGDFISTLYTILGRRLLVATDVIHVNPLWLIPDELWNERLQRFEWESPFSDLLSRISNFMMESENLGDKS